MNAPVGKKTRNAMIITTPGGRMKREGERRRRKGGREGEGRRWRGEKNIHITKSYALLILHMYMHHMYNLRFIHTTFITLMLIHLYAPLQYIPTMQLKQ